MAFQGSFLAAFLLASGKSESSPVQRENPNGEPQVFLFLTHGSSWRLASFLQISMNVESLALAKRAAKARSLFCVRLFERKIRIDQKHLRMKDK